LVNGEIKLKNSGTLHLGNKMTKDLNNKLGDIVWYNDKVCRIISTYEYKRNDWDTTGTFDWEIVYITGKVIGLIGDCAKDEWLKPYEWKPYPRTLWDKIKLLFKNDN